MSALWLRHEVRATERRAALVPEDARTLVASGIPVTVEESPQRVFPIADYADAGCAVAPAGSWVDAPDDVFVLGLKELPDEPPRLRHRHVYFGHTYKEQRGAAELLRRFADGGGALLDLEYLTDATGRRLAAFGYWAGYVGAALAVLHLRDALTTPLVPTSRADLDAALKGADDLRALVIGALGRCGRGARDALTAAGVTPTEWDLAETRDLDKAALIRHDLLVNAVLTVDPVPPFVTDADLDDPDRRLRVVADVTCDVTSDRNVLPIYDRITDWDAPARRLRDDRPVDVIAIDNLPSLLPLEASVSFSADLTPHLRTLADGDAWTRALARFHDAVTGVRS
ncbi:saccharopine dehydrogenase [Actinokineospora auranticolor]|uniref:Saccharopine dehydrogenase [NAD(+), L-lysine-forming] n=1 Tax=Actinokineospora auranticolor TaxID=155976 RepID=A0A2S6GGV3_9PSEU|nr:saccharopine dehydrogenase [Actinokineospora auranticolor]PPK64452.1 saccharopine dehydrogenase (NAD+, L-lysine forming) [Actinokineospora auranticolor]